MSHLLGHNLSSPPPCCVQWARLSLHSHVSSTWVPIPRFCFPSQPGRAGTPAPAMSPHLWGHSGVPTSWGLGELQKLLAPDSL